MADEYVLSTGDNTTGLSEAHAWTSLVGYQNSQIANSHASHLHIGAGTWDMPGTMMGNGDGAPNGGIISGVGDTTILRMTTDSYAGPGLFNNIGVLSVNNLKIVGALTDGNYQFPFQLTDSAESNVVTLTDIITESESDGIWGSIYAAAYDLSITAIGCQFSSKFDTARFLTGSTGTKKLTFNAVNCDFTVAGPFTATVDIGDPTGISGNTLTDMCVARPISGDMRIGDAPYTSMVESGNTCEINLWGGTITASNGGKSYTCGVFANQGTTINLHGVKIRTSSNNGPCYDVIAANGGVVNLYNGCDYDPAKIYTETGGVVNTLGSMKMTILGSLLWNQP